jgi:cyclopropane fatty-acyl-phospholipid synthase-like methyltransferase
MWLKKKDKVIFEPKEVGNYYNEFTDKYLETYGNVIQAFRPTDTEQLHKYLIQSADLKDHQRILDAGCGVGGPAIYFAKNIKSNIEGITISSKQVSMANNFKNKELLEGTVHFKEGDYHKLSEFYENQKFDRILFLESLGHAFDPGKVLKEAESLLDKNGRIYIKDFFPFEIEDKQLNEKHSKVIENINKSYCYNVLDLHETITTLRKLKMEILFIRKFDFQDDISARAAFEEQMNINLFGEMQEFRVAEWLELCFLKPE